MGLYFSNTKQKWIVTFCPISCEESFIRGTNYGYTIYQFENKNVARDFLAEYEGAY